MKSCVGKYGKVAGCWVKMQFNTWSEKHIIQPGGARLKLLK